MHLRINGPDRTISVDGEALTFPFEINPDIVAITWDGKSGYVERVQGESRGFLEVDVIEPFAALFRTEKAQRAALAEEAKVKAEILGAEEKDRLVQEELINSAKRQLEQCFSVADRTAIRCAMANIPFPPDWQEYVAALRAISNAGIPEHGQVQWPRRPDFPAGS